jgi:hypothetical protein
MPSIVFSAGTTVESTMPQRVVDNDKNDDRSEATTASPFFRAVAGDNGS